MASQEAILRWLNLKRDAWQVQIRYNKDHINCIIIVVISFDE